MTIYQVNKENMKTVKQHTSVTNIKGIDFLGNNMFLITRSKSSGGFPPQTIYVLELHTFSENGFKFVREINNLGANISDIRTASDGKNIFIALTISGFPSLLRILYFNINSKDSLFFSNFSNNSTNGLTFDGKYLWNSKNKTIQKFSIKNNQIFLIQEINHTTSSKGLYHDGKYLWKKNLTDFIKIDALTGTEIKIINADFSLFNDITSDGKFLYVV